MEINAQFDERVLTHTDQINWLASPMPGVDRRMLDRIGDEVARATSIVRYAPDSAFPEHSHSGGEEFIVLDGVFQDEHGDYPAGTYVRNPVGTHHIPRSKPGCTIFVKLWQFDPYDQEQFALDLGSQELLQSAPNIRSAVLARRDYETVTLEEWDASANVRVSDPGGLEILILEGGLNHEGESYCRHDWIRWPAGEEAKFEVSSEGAKLWIKRGHLAQIRVPHA